MKHHTVKRVVGAAYEVIAAAAFMQLEGVKSPCDDTGGGEQTRQQAPARSDY